MTRNRIIWFCLWVLSVVGISLRGGAVTYGFFALLTLVPFLSLLYLLAVYMLFHIYQEVEQRYAAVNEPVTYRFALVNEYPLQFVSIRVRFFTAFSSITDLDDETEYELRPYTRIEKTTRLVCRYRGEYDVGIREIEIQDFFRLFRFRYRNKECVHAVVRPQLVQIDSLGETELSDAVRNSLRSKTELDLLSREYVPGDDPRFINWTQSARTGTLMTRLLTGSDHQEIAVLTDTYRGSLEPEEFLPSENKILETALAICYAFSRDQISAAEYHLGQELVRLTVESTWQFETFYQMMSEVRFSSQYTHERLNDAALHCRELLDSAMVFLIVASWNVQTDALVREMEDHELHVVICLISDGGIPDLSGHRGCRLIRISPDSDLTKGLGA